MLQVLDLLAQDSHNHSSLRELARQVLRHDACHERAIEWKTSPARRRIQRLVAEARQLANGGYLELLACRMPKPVTRQRF
jgi:hypothetical protein